MITLTPIYPEDTSQAAQAYFDPAFMVQRLGRDGYWCGGGARTLQLTNPVQPEAFERMFSAAERAGANFNPALAPQHPPTLGWRLTFPTAPRMNALWAVADREPRLLIEQAHSLAVKQTLYRMEWLMGVDYNQRWDVDGGALPACVAATFRTGASRDRAPELTTTAFLFNVAVLWDGRSHAYAPEEVARAHKAVGEFYVKALNTAIRERLGPIPIYNHRDRELCMAAASLTSHIRFQAENGGDNWPTLDAASRTEHRAWQFAQWRRQATEVGWGSQKAAAYLLTYKRKQVWERFTSAIRGGLAESAHALRRIVSPPPRSAQGLDPYDQPAAQQQSKARGYTHSH